MHGEMPAGGAAHRKAAHGDSVFIDAIVLLDGFERFEHIDFAGELEGIAVASIRMQHDRIRTA